MDKVSTHTVAAQFEGLLFERMLAPLESAFGETGSMIAAPLAQSLASRERTFNAFLTRLLERSHD